MAAYAGPGDMNQLTVFFRNDDVSRIEPGLVEITNLLNGMSIPISHAVEPANLECDAKNWLLERVSGGVEIIQHGFSHARHDTGEFGGNRSAVDQARDLRAGLQIMEDSFGDAFFPAMSFPFGSYNRHSIRLLGELGYSVVSCHWRHQLSRRLFYRAGRALGRGQLLGRHVSHHLKHYPGTKMMEISVTVAPIAEYLVEEGPCACRFKSQEDLRNIFNSCRQLSPVVGIVLHHRYRCSTSALGQLEEFVRWIVDQPGVEFSTIGGIYRQLLESGLRS